MFEHMLSKQKYGIFLFIFTMMIFFNIQIASCYSWHGSELWDLEYNDDRFLEELKDWTATSLVKPEVKHTMCDNTYLMGGNNVFKVNKDQYFQRIYTNLPPHNQLNLRYVVYPIDSWDGNQGDHYEIFVDGYTQIGWKFQHTSSYAKQACGSTSWKEYPPVEAVSTFAHSGPNVTIRFISMLDQVPTDESLAIRDVKMQFVNVENPKNSLCGRSTANVPLPDSPCQGCDSSHQYMTLPSSGTCLECASSCATCTAGGDSACTSCYDGTYINGKTCKKCDSGCATCNNGDFCLTCQPSFWMASSKCFPSCTYPLFITESEGISYCKTPCEENQWAMWDGSCSSSCPSELSAAVLSTYQVCTFPCSINPVAN